VRLTEGVEAAAPNGLTVHADLRDEYLVGFPLVVELSVRNDTSGALSGPDLLARRHLVHFKLTSPSGATSERFTTPPDFDTAADWTIAPHNARRVLLEVPSSSTFEPGEWQLTVMVGDAATHVDLPSRTIRVLPARPVPGAMEWEPTVARASGALVTWAHRAKAGFDLYLDQYAPGTGDDLSARYHLLHSDAELHPSLALSAASSPRSRHIYWQSGPSEFQVARLEGSRLDGLPRVFGAPWPRVEPIARGLSDATGGFMLPLWVPGPSAPGGSVRVLCADARGGIVFRPVADFPSRPAVATSGIDAGGNLVFALAHEGGLDLYRVAADWPAAFPASGKRAWKQDGTWTSTAAAFDILPDGGAHPGGLYLAVLQARTSTEDLPAMSRLIRVDLAGKLFDTGAAVARAQPGTSVRLYPAGFESPHVVARTDDGHTSVSKLGGEAVMVGALPEAGLWPGRSTGWRLRWLEGETVVSERTLTLD
jgi:hypothetical protein